VSDTDHALFTKPFAPPLSDRTIMSSGRRRPAPKPATADSAVGNTIAEALGEARRVVEDRLGLGKGSAE
jgi:hypothetical protein